MKASSTSAGTASSAWKVRRPRRLGSYLAGVSLAILVPALGVGIAAASHMAQNYRGSFERRLQDTARALALAVDAEIGTALSAVQTLAASPALDDEAGFAAFGTQASRVGETFGTYIVVSSPFPPRQVLNTRFPPGATLPPMVAPDTVTDVLRARRTALTDLRIPPVLGEPVVGAIAPVLRDGASPTLAVVMPVRPRRFANLLNAQGFAGESFAVVVDGNGLVVARSAQHERFLGHPAPDWYLRDVQGRDEGLLHGQALAGNDMIYGFKRLQSAPGWTVAVAEPFAAYRDAWLLPLLGLAFGGALVLAVGMLLSAAVARQILRPVAALAQRAEVTAGQRAAAPPARSAPTAITEFVLLENSVDRAEAALRVASARLEAALRAASLGVFEHHLPNGCRWDERGAAIFGGLTSAQCNDGLRAWRERVHPEDREAVDSAVDTAAAPGGSGAYSVEFRFQREEGGWNWITAHGAVTERDPATGRATWLAGVVKDVTERKATEERQLLLMREVDHRAKNALAVVQATLRLTPKDDGPAFARAVEGRVHALARAHSLLAANRWSGAELGELARGELEAFLPGIGDREGGPMPVVEVAGPRLPLRPAAAQAVSMALHELATNATKHGALSRATGRVRLAWGADEASGVLWLRWTERAGPPVDAPPLRRGFGTRVIEGTIRDQLGGRVVRRWETEGLVCELELPLHDVVGKEEPYRRAVLAD